MEPYLFDGVAPSYTYIVRVALQHLNERARGKENKWVRSAEERLHLALNRFNHRWGLDTVDAG